MHPPSIIPFIEYATTLDKQSVRLIPTADGVGVLQCTIGLCAMRFQMVGRPDGLQPGGAASTLELLRTKILGAAKIRPQDWMELDREQSLYDQRSRAALIAAADACQQGRYDVAIRLSRLSSDDISHQLAIVALAVDAHPAGGLPGANPSVQPALCAQRCVAEALPCLIANGPAAAQTRLRKGITEVTNQLNALGESVPGENAIVRRLSALIARLDSSSAPTPVSSATNAAV